MAKTARFRVCLYAYTDLQQHHVATEYLHTPFLQQFPHSVSGVSCLCYWCVPFHGNQVQATIATTHIPEHVTIQSQLQFTLLLFSLVPFAVFPSPFLVLIVNQPPLKLSTEKFPRPFSSR